MSKIFLSASHFHKTCCNKTKSRVAFLSHKYKTFHLILQEAPHEFQNSPQTGCPLVAQITLEEQMSRLLYSPPPSPRLNICEFHWWNEVSHDVARTGTATVFPHTIAMAAFDPELLEQAADAIFTEGRTRHFAAHSGRSGSVPKSERTGRSGVPRRTPIWQKSEDHRRFQLPPRQPAEPPCRLPCKKPAPPHHQHRPAASGFLPEPRDLGGNLLPIAHSEALKDPAIQKMAEKYGAPRSALHPLRFGAGRGCPPQNRKSRPHGGQRQGGLFHFL